MFGSGSGGFSFGGASNSGASAGSTGGSKSGFSFGSNNNNNATSGTSTTGGGFSFGAGANNSTAPKPATGGGLFGGSSTTNTGSTGGGLFGSNNNTTSQPAGTTGGGLFGSNNNTTAQPSTGGGLFGSKPATTTPPSSGGGLFGSNNTTAQPSTGGGLFGNNNNNTQQQQSSGGLFGSNNQQQQQPSGGLFGNNNQQQQTQQQPAQSSQPSFAWSQPSTANQTTLPQQQQPLSFTSNTQQDSQINSNYTANIQEQLTKIKNSWNPTSQQASLQTFFYNAVPENQSALYTKPVNENDEWDKAYANRPSTNSIPVRAVGFEDLQKRSQTQINHVAQARVILQQISEKNKMLSDKHDLDTASRIISAKARHTRISKRILRLVSALAVLKSKGYQLSPNEEKLIQNFQELLNKSQDPSGLGKSNELWARLAVLKEKAKSLNDQLDNTLGIQKLDSNNVDDINDSEQKQNQILKIAQVLQQQQNGIKYLSEIIENDEEIVSKLLK
ncbi:Nucleoporin [Wickerhamomyces ciferrii]|uniref:Nucleoporin n=1 Tax=Wickerhamomyces ciferrii (strain ATCC 14091 / BCRC 22168 / CBS 111 / JCM 3599 / NBRC 0793 / NRRL Y-1031 F-60-10) TaxID=1206466 RepID=K0KBB8_WICCF|nr:Nucleoporin [Wickerhamomyces ciferrii]CCH42295.1 Nucleoporin [Wickerhamomyces ciferrii]